MNVGCDCPIFENGHELIGKCHCLFLETIWSQTYTNTTAKVTVQVLKSFPARNNHVNLENGKINIVTIVLNQRPIRA